MMRRSVIEYLARNPVLDGRAAFAGGFDLICDDAEQRTAARGDETGGRPKTTALEATAHLGSQASALVATVRSIAKQDARARMSRSVSRCLSCLAVAVVAAISLPAASRSQEPSLAGQMKSLIAILRVTAFRPEWKLHPDEYAANGISPFFPTDPTAEYTCLDGGCYAFGSIEAPFNISVTHGPDGSLSANFILKETDPAKMNRADQFQITPLTYLGTACFSVAAANYLHKSKLDLEPDALSKEVDSVFAEMGSKNNTQDFQRGIIGGLKMSFPKYRVTLDLASTMPNVSCAILYDTEGGISELDSVANELAGSNAAR